MEGFATKFFDWLLRESWQASILVLIVLALQWAFQKKLTAAWRHALWLLVIIKLSLPLSPSSALSIFNIAHAASSSNDPAQGLGNSDLPGVIKNGSHRPPVPAFQGGNGSPVQHAASEPHAQTPPPGKRFSFLFNLTNTNHCFWFLWSLGAAFLSLRMAIQSRRFSIRLRNANPLGAPPITGILDECRKTIGVGRGMALVQTDAVLSPALYGLFRPVLLLPRHLISNFNPEELRYVFLHELAHVKRYDMALHWLATSLSILHWFNPILWFAFRRMAADRELACDELALSKAEVRDYRPYGLTIIKLLGTWAHPESAPGLMGMLQDKSQMARRISTIAAFRKRPRFSTIAFLLFPLLAVVSLTEARNTKVKVIHLQGGTELTLAAITKGPTNMYMPATRVQRFLHLIGFSKGIHIGKFRIQPPHPIDDTWHTRDGKIAWPNKAVIWLRHSGPSNAPPLPIPEQQWFYDIRATLADGSGEEWEARPGLARFHAISSTNLYGFSAWDFSAFPRRGNRLTFKLYGRNGFDKWDVLAAFSIPNPSRAAYPTWKPAPLPATQDNGDLDVSLVKLISGSKFVKQLMENRPFTTATFRIAQKGRPTEAWVPDRMEATDATGNEGTFPIVFYGVTNAVAYYEGQNTSLSPSEIWRLRFRFCNERASESVWESPALTVQNGLLDKTNISTNFNASMISLFCSQDTLRVDLNPSIKGTKLQLLSIIDDRGRKLNTSIGGYSDQGFNLQLTLSQETHSIKVKISLPETRQFEFVAQPTRQVAKQ